MELHEHDLEYSRWENYTEVWTCRVIGCDFEHRHYLECQ